MKATSDPYCTRGHVTALFINIPVSHSISENNEIIEG